MACHASCSETGREAVSQWSDVIKSSIQITASESRETYLLNTVREDLSEDGLIRRCRFGRKDPATRNRTIILLGETGTGKSTLINMMLNYMLGVKWEDKVRFEIIRDEGERSKTESQTSVTTAYEIHGLENLSVPFSLTVIDTPGFGGTDGPEKDKITAQNLYMLFSSSSIFKQIDAVCLVMKASQNRLSSSQKYIFDTILSLFGKIVEKNIMILITFSDWTPPVALNVVYESGVPFLRDVNNEPVHFLFNNFPPNKFARKCKEEYQTGWNKGTNSFRKFFKTLDKMEPQSLERAVKVSGERLSPPAGKLPGNSAMAQSHTSCSETGREAVSQWSDVIKSSIQITASGPRETYLLNTVREDLSKDGLIRRCRFGSKDPATRNRTIILVGETGTGKSTLINMMLNYILGVKWEDKVRFEIIRDEGGRPQTESQTTTITAYEIHGLESLSVPFSLTVIDTPGFGNTEGPEKDKITVQNLHMLLKSFSGFDEIDAVCLVVKAFLCHLSPSQKYIFDTILSLFGKNLEKNIMTLFTFSDWTPPAALNLITESGVPFSKNESDEPVYFLFNNLPLQKFRKQHEEAFRTNWDAGTESFSKFFQAFEQMKPQSSFMTTNILQERQSLDTCVQSLESHVKDVQTKRKALLCKQKTLDELMGNMRKQKSQDEDPYAGWKKINIGGAAIICKTCEVLCPSPPEWMSLWLSSQKCAFCPGKCSFKHHDFKKDVYIRWDKTNTETDVDDEKEAEHKIVTIRKEISKLEQDLKSAEAEMTKLQDRRFECIQQLRENALKFDSDATPQSIGRLTEVLQRNYNIQWRGHVPPLVSLFKTFK
ncbi:hypothetical protein GJAV_G00104910 [Gymnothorax javanicus]|nr:hypothetical protein GJAV_G00104910 [Gymnothorax javanicus]